MLIQHQRNGSKGSFFIQEGDERLAGMTYTLPGNGMMIIEHTEVADALRGKNIGYQLVHAAVEYARENTIKIIPLCPFAKAVFNKRGDEWADVLKS